MVNFFQKLFSFFCIISEGYGAYKYKILLLTFLGFGGSFLEGIGITALIPLFALVTGNGGIGDNFISKFTEKFFVFFNIDWSIRYLLVFIASLFVFKGVLLVFSFYLNLKIMSDYQRELKQRLMDKMLLSDWPHLLKQKLGYLETMISVNVASASSLLGQIGNVVIISTSLAVYLFIAVNISFPITIVTTLICAVIFIVFRPIFKKIKQVSGALEKANKDVAHHVGEHVLGMKTVKVMDVGRKISDISRQYFTKMRDLQIKQGIYGVLRGALIEPASIILILAIFAFSYKLPTFNLAVFLAVMYLIKQVFSYTEQLQKKILSIYSIAPYLMSIVAYEKAMDESVERGGGERPFKFGESLELKNVSFSYQPGSHSGASLKNINLKINKGEMVGLIGPSGAGKTTMVDLILRLLKPSEGGIFLDGISADDISLSLWRKKIGYVSQDIFLLNGTIEENVRFYDENLTTEEIKEALSKANILDFVESCPKGLQTVIGDRGIMLSNGQRQRIIIGRILARKPEFLILDEATSALDNESEKKIHDALGNLKGRVTVLIVAHRLSTLSDADRLVIIEDGKISESGSPADLLKNKESYFFKVYNIQH